MSGLHGGVLLQPGWVRFDPDTFQVLGYPYPKLFPSGLYQKQVTLWFRREVVSEFAGVQGA